MTNTWLFQLTISIVIILSTSLVAKRLLEISLSKSFLVSVCSIILFSMLLHSLGLYKFTIYCLILISIIPFLFSNIRKIILERKFLIIEFILLILVVFYLSKDRILMDEDELYFWAVKYKYFVMHFNDVFNYNINSIKEPYNLSPYGNATALFQAFVTSFVGYTEGGAIFANNILIICTFYFLFGDRIKKVKNRIFYLLILYLILNNLSFGLASIYNDPTVATFYAVLIYYLFNNFDYKNLKNLILLFILIITFIEIHRISILFINCLLIIFLIKNFEKNNLIKLFLGIGLIVICIYLIIVNTSVYIFNFNFLSLLNLNEILFIIKNIFLSKNYNSQFGVSYNEIINFLKIDFLNMPEYIWHNFIWYLICLVMAIINGKKAIKLNIFFLIVFCIMSLAIVINKIYINNTSPQVFGRYISFIIIPCILINLLYYTPFTKNKYISLLVIVGLLITSTPKKTFGFFFPKDIYREYDQWNKNYFKAREKHNKIIRGINNGFNNRPHNVIAIFKDKDIIYEAHPSLYQSALKLDLYPNNVTALTFNRVSHKDFNLFHYFQNQEILIFYNLDSNQKKIVKELTKKMNIKREFDFSIIN